MRQINTPKAILVIFNIVFLLIVNIIISLNSRNQTFHSVLNSILSNTLRIYPTYMIIHQHYSFPHYYLTSCRGKDLLVSIYENLNRASQLHFQPNRA